MNSGSDTLEKQIYENLIRELCDLAGIRSQEQVLSTGTLMVGDHPVLLSNNPEQASGGLHARFDLGVTNFEQGGLKQQRLLYQLLVDNFGKAMGGQRAWGVAPLQQHAVLSLAVPLASTEGAASLEDWLRNAVFRARENWATLRSLAERPDGLDLPGLASHSPDVMPGAALMGRRAEAEERYQTLLDRFCDLHDFQNRSHFLETGMLKVQDVPMLLRHDWQRDILELRMDLGEGHEHGTAQQWLRLLISNFLFGTEGRMIFCIRPDDGHVLIQLQHQSVSGMEASDLSALLQASAQHARGFWDECSKAARLLGDHPSWPEPQCA